MSYVKLEDPREDVHVDREQGTVPASTSGIENTLDEPVSTTIVVIIDLDA
jgi:hypothetical protein